MNHLRQQKERFLGQLLCGVVHEFSNYVAIIRSSLELIDSRDLSPQQAEAISRSLLGVDRANSLLEELANFALLNDACLARVDLAKEIPALQRDLHAILGDDVALVVHVESAPLDVITSRALLRKVLAAIVKNSKEAMLGEGWVRINVGPASCGSRVDLVIDDSGVGMSDDVRDQACEPFFSTKGSSAVGLGLALVQCFVDLSQATMEVLSKEQEGGTIHISFPRAPSNAPTLIL